MGDLLTWFGLGLIVIALGVVGVIAFFCIVSVFDQTYREPGFRNNWDRWLGGFLLLLIVPTALGFLVQL